MKNKCKHRRAMAPIMKNCDVGWIEWCKECGAIRMATYMGTGRIKKSKWRSPGHATNPWQHEWSEWV